ncbi:class I SAM-dependent methyltransferase [Chloroflexota bacterium]
MPDWETDNLFTGTAYYYARYRPDYPEQVIRLLMKKFNLNGNSKVLDLGCGTGQVALRLAPSVSEVVAIDPTNEMLEEGKALAARREIHNVKWLKSESTHLTKIASDVGTVDLTVIARAFHWMDREQTLRDLYQLTRTGGGLAILLDVGPESDSSSAPWQSIISDTVISWLGDIRKAGTKGTYVHPQKRFESYLSESQFHNLESVEFETDRLWTIDQIVGYLYSTSSASIPVLGDKKESFEEDLRNRLSMYKPNGLFDEKTITRVIMVWK